MEASFYASIDIMIIAQNEKYLNAAYSGVIKKLLQSRLLLPYLLKMYVDNWGRGCKKSKDDSLSKYYVSWWIRMSEEGIIWDIKAI